jgi:glyoxylase-like metal-dependent hydrolase (beta-lactamase superfamily II)
MQDDVSAVHQIQTADGRPKSHSWQVGSATITAFEEELHSYSLAEVLRGSGQPNTTVEMAVNGFLIDLEGGRRIVVDTCIGAHHHSGSGTVPFVALLEKAGIAADSIDTVVSTHSHFDHVGGHVTRDPDSAWRPAFPRARYLLAAPEWREPSDEEPPVAWSNFAITFRTLLAFDALDLVGEGYDLGSGARLLPTPGHTPGHTSVLVESGGHGAVITGDAMHLPLQLTSYAEGSVFDGDPDLAAISRKRLVDMASDERWLVVGNHFPPPTAAYVDSAGGQVQVQRVEGRPELPGEAGASAREG